MTEVVVIGIGAALPPTIAIGVTGWWIARLVYYVRRRRGMADRLLANLRDF